jgi:DNA ligase (NAD+)
MGRGFGLKKIKSITDIYPEIIENTVKGRNKALKLKPDDLLKINGIAKISAELFMENIQKYYDFYDSLGFKCKGREVRDASDAGEVDKVKKAFNNNFKDKIFIFSGFRNKDYEKIIEDNGGKVTTSISKNSHYLIVKDKEENSAKIIKARELGVTILDIEDFKRML